MAPARPSSRSAMPAIVAISASITVMLDPGSVEGKLSIGARRTTVAQPHVRYSAAESEGPVGDIVLIRSLRDDVPGLRGRSKAVLVAKFVPVLKRNNRVEAIVLIDGVIPAAHGLVVSVRPVLSEAIKFCVCPARLGAGHRSRIFLSTGLMRLRGITLFGNGSRIYVPKQPIPLGVSFPAKQARFVSGSKMLML